MKDLQELFESLGSDEMKKLSELMDKKSLNPTNTKKIMDMISIVYCGEMGIKEAEVSSEEVATLIDSFTLSVALYQNVVIGHMEITGGRLMLTNDKSCSFKLTSDGINHVEKNLLKH